MPDHTAARRLIVCADDFGRDLAINEAVEIAHRGGILSTASLMVAAPAAADAVTRARRLPQLRVGLHLLLVDGVPLLPPATLTPLLRRDGRFDDNQLRAGLRWFFLPGMRRRLAAEIEAQFAAFKATGLVLDHVNAHKHMHVHPTVARLIVEIGRPYGLRAVRLPNEPAAVLRRAFPGERHRVPSFRPAVAALRRRLRREGLASNDHAFGMAWSGVMTEERLLGLLPHLPPGVSEVYFHPATRESRDLATAMPGYRHVDELGALLSARVRGRIAELGISLVGYGDLAPPR
ncbi:MAG TPA: hopanoid biosynthesis-associated protein HpnK [Stellaceae bacterium]|nr:hopanoid biosynthesis-associated protein HpnK [Stellaceae bacterium]